MQQNGFQRGIREIKIARVKKRDVKSQTRNAEVARDAVDFPSEKNLREIEIREVYRKGISKKRRINHSGSICGRRPSNPLNYVSRREKLAGTFARKGFARDEARIPEFSRATQLVVSRTGNGEENVARVRSRSRHFSPKTRYIFLFVAAQYFRAAPVKTYTHDGFLRELRSTALSRIPPCRRGDIGVGFQFRFNAGEHESSTPSPNPGKEWEIERLVGRSGRGVHVDSSDGILPYSSTFRGIGTAPRARTLVGPLPPKTSSKTRFFMGKRKSRGTSISLKYRGILVTSRKQTFSPNSLKITYI